MERTRVAVLAALVVVLSVGSVVLAAGANLAPEPLAAVTWPVSTLVVSEVQTGGSSASDEFAEITNVGVSAVDLAGLELVYATSTGSTVTRKASWSTTLLLEPGRHLFVANTSGIYASLADATYSGGFAATGGAIVLRPIGGTPVDAIGWGDATNAFVEGSPIAAPVAGSSIERKPGGLAGNATDTNSNAVDWFTQTSPNPQSLSSPPVPAPSASPTPAPTASPTAAPTPTAAASSTPSPTDSPAPSPTPAPPTPSVEPTAAPTVEPTLEPSAEPTTTIAPSPEPTIEPVASSTVQPTPTVEPTTAPTVAPTSAPTPGPTATPTPNAVSIATARGLADGSTATIAGVLTTPLGALESARKAFVQDDTAGIALYLDAAVTDELLAGTLVMATGTIDDRFAERTLRVSPADVSQLGAQEVPTALSRTTGAISEAVEGSRVRVQGVAVGASSDLADGLGLMVDDGSGQVRVIVGAAALAGAAVPGGATVVAVGPVGQRDSSGTGLAGYRIHVTEAGDFQVIPRESPSPTPAPSPTSAPTPSPSPSPAPTPSAAPSPTPAPTPSPAPGRTPAPTATPGPTPPPTVDIVEARGAPVGTVLTVAGVVTAEAGRLGLPPVIAIADGTGGIAIRLPEGVAAPARGTTVQVRGPLADPYGQLELRPSSAAFKVTGHGSLPASNHLTAAQLGEVTEGRLAELVGTVTAPPRKSTSGDLAIDVVDGAGTAFRAIADGSSRISAGDLLKDHTYRLVGIVGQRATRKGALDGYRLYLRDRGDIAAMSAGDSGASPSPRASGAPGATVPVSTALAVPDGTVLTIEAVVTAGATLLDSSGRRIVVEDATGAIEILLPNGAPAPGVATRVRVTGETGLAWGAPRIAASAVNALGGGASVAPTTLHRAPAERDEWLLVRLSGTVLKVARIGERWRAEITLADGTKAPIQGQAGAGIPSTAIVAGRRITVTGIVRRPYPTASDRRFAVLPRNGADLAVGPDGKGNSGGTAGLAAGGGIGATGTATSAADAVTPDTDLATIADLVGKRVRVGGLIARVAEAGFDLDDGTALARVELRGAMVDLVPLLREGEAIAATGTVELLDGGPVVVVDETGSLVRVGTLGQAVPIGAAGGSDPTASAGSGVGALRADAGAGIGGGPAPASLLALAGLTALSVLATILRRRLLRRRLRVALIDRLATLRTGASEHESA